MQSVHYCKYHLSDCLSVHSYVTLGVVPQRINMSSVFLHRLRALIPDFSDLNDVAKYERDHPESARVLYRDINKKAQLSLINPRDAKACQKLLPFDVLTTLSLTILAYLHAFSCCCVRNMRNPEKFTENSNL